jgi:tryptophan synthase alpha chain
MSRIADAFARARREGRAAFIAYLTAGDPSADATAALARAVDRAGADILELGVPFSDPIADGPVLQRSAARALAAGTTLRDVFSIARRIREETSLALILFSYVNPILRFGVEAAAREARQAGFDGVLLTDVPPEEAREFHPRLREALLDTILLVSPTSPERRMREAARLSSGFLYVVSRAGTTGVRGNLPRELPQTVRRARRAAGALPVAVGFGIATPETARQAARVADGIVVGSALMHAAEREGTQRERCVERLVRELVAACGRSRGAAK